MERQKNKNLIAAIIFLPVFYAVGITGLLIPSTQLLFEKLVPLSLLLTCALLIAFQPGNKQPAYFTFAAVALVSFFIEMIGVNTGKIFGHYQYGSALGWRLFNTPLVIGLNWLMLIAGTYNLVNRIGIISPWRELCGAAVLTGLDFLIEPVAVRYNWWSWQSDVVPMQNYIAWFYISFIFLWLFFRMKISNNQIAMMVIVIQLFFFSILNLWERI